MSREHRILVGPVEGGWAVRWDGAMQPLMFLSGRRAEEHARQLAKALTRSGDEASVVIRDRSEALVGGARYSPANLGELSAGH
jgi:hypothetical protein